MFVQPKDASTKYEIPKLGSFEMPLEGAGFSIFKKQKFVFTIINFVKRKPVTPTCFFKFHFYSLIPQTPEGYPMNLQPTRCCCVACTRQHPILFQSLNGRTLQPPACCPALGRPPCRKCPGESGSAP